MKNMKRNPSQAKRKMPQGAKHQASNPARIKIRDLVTPGVPTMAADHPAGMAAVQGMAVEAVRESNFTSSSLPSASHRVHVDQARERLL